MSLDDGIGSQDRMGGESPAPSELGDISSTSSYYSVRLQHLTKSAAPPKRLFESHQAAHRSILGGVSSGSPATSRGNITHSKENDI